MMQRLKARQITILVSSDMHEEIESYIRAQEGTDWDDIVNEALDYWYGLMPRRAMARQRVGLESHGDFRERPTLPHSRAAHNYHLGRRCCPRGEA